MEQEKKYMMLACRNIEDEIDAAMKEAGTNFPVIYLQSGTHDNPDKMHRVIQNLIDSLTGIDYLLLPMGRCGNSTLGLCSDRFSLVLPLFEDCINLILSKDSLKVHRPKGCMFFTQGWLRSSQAAPNEYDKTVAKYGEEQCQMLMKMIYGGYTHFGILDTGLYDMEKAKQILTPLAQCIPVEFMRLDAPYGVLKKMVRLELEDPNFVIVPPGVPVTEEMLEAGE